MTRFGNLRPRSKSKGPFARIPAWIYHDNGGTQAFKLLRASEFKVLGCLASKANNDTDETPAFTISSLAKATDLSRDTVRASLKILQNLKIIVLIQTKRGLTAARILFTPPNYDRTAADYTPTLQARLSVPVDETPKNSPASDEEVVTEVPVNPPVDRALKGDEKFVTPSTAFDSVVESPGLLTASEASPPPGIAGGGFVGFARDDPSFLESLSRLKKGRP